MSSNNSPDLQNLSGVGNIVTAGLQLYRSRFRTYFKLAVLAHLWLLVPLLGWVESFAISTLIARSAFADLTGTPTAIATLRAQTDKLRWRIFVADSVAIAAVWVAALGIYLGLAVMLGIMLVILRMSLPSARDPVFSMVLGSAALALMLGAGLLVYTPFFVLEVAAAVEQIPRARTMLRRSLSLSRASFLKVLGVILTVFLITFPLSFAFVWFCSQFLAFIRFLPIFASSRTTLQMLQIVLVIAIALLTSALTFPLWQTTKAALYYYLRRHREGLDLRLREPSEPD